jgi:hypothetical protein
VRCLKASHSYGAALVCATLVSATIVHAQASGSYRNRQGYVAVPGRMYRELPCVPTPIKPHELDCWMWVLNLSGPQRQALDGLYQAYIEKEEAAHFRYVQPLWDATADLCAQGPVMSNVALALENQAIIEQRLPGAVAHLDRLESDLIDQLTPILTDQQLAKLPLVRAMRARLRLRAAPPRYPGAEVDLVAVLHDLQRREVDLTPVDPVFFQTAISDYGIKARAMAERRVQALRVIAAEGTVLLARHLRGEAPDGSLKLQLKDLNRRLVQAEKSLHDLNVQTIELLKISVPASSAAEIETIFEEIVYPPVFPDPTEISSVVIEVRESAGASSESAAAVAAIFTEFDERRRQINERMKNRFLEWRELHGVEWATPAGILQTYQGDMRDLHEERMANCRSAIASIAAALGIDPSGNKVIKDFEARLSAYKLLVDARLGV